MRNKRNAAPRRHSETLADREARAARRINSDVPPVPWTRSREDRRTRARLGFHVCARAIVASVLGEGR